MKATARQLPDGMFELRPVNPVQKIGNDFDSTYEFKLFERNNPTRLSDANLEDGKVYDLEEFEEVECYQDFGKEWIEKKPNDIIVEDRLYTILRPRKTVTDNPEVEGERGMILQLEISKIVDDLVNGNTHPVTAKNDLFKLFNPPQTTKRL